MFDDERKNELRRDIGRQIKQERNEYGLSVRELSDLCGVTYQNINKIENGCYNASVDVVNRIIGALNCHVKIEKNKR